MAHTTIRDVAARAGVSKSLVSLVLRGQNNVSPERHAAVLRAVAELGYRPNAAARSLVQRRTHMVGVLLSDLHNPFFAEITDGIQYQAQECGYRILITTGERTRESEAEALETLLELRADGLILAGPQLSSRVIAETGRTVPIVVVAGRPTIPTVDTVVNDDLFGAAQAVTYLCELGHRRIGHIDGGRDPGAALRRRGYEAAMERHGLAEYVAVGAGEFTEAGGRQGALALLELPSPPTAIFAANDLAAVGAISVIEELGMRVPDDISVMGYDNTSLAALRHVALSTVDQPRFVMGQDAVRLMLERLNGRSRARRVVLAPTLVTRATTARPPGRARR